MLGTIGYSDKESRTKIKYFESSFLHFLSECISALLLRIKKVVLFLHHFYWINRKKAVPLNRSKQD